MSERDLLAEAIKHADNLRMLSRWAREQNPNATIWLYGTQAADFIESALAKQAGETRETGWQPIEGAPRDGRYFMGACFEGQRLVWVKDVRWVMAEDVAEEWGCSPDICDAGWDHDGDECSPTHYIPLPAPPAIAQEKN